MIAQCMKIPAGILNTPNCGYDGGDCCPQTCRKGGFPQLNTTSPEEREQIIRQWTNDSRVIQERLRINDTDILSISYAYSCHPATFVCNDPVAQTLPLLAEAPPAPTSDTFLNASCGDFEQDPRYGDGTSRLGSSPQRFPKVTSSPKNASIQILNNRFLRWRLQLPGVQLR